MKFSIPAIIRLNGSDAYFCKLEGRKQKFKNYFFEKRALLGADEIVSVSGFTAKETNAVFKIEKCTKIIYNGINVLEFKPLNSELNENQILYFGTIIRKKGVLELAKAFNILVETKPEVSLILLGKDVPDIFEKKSTLELFFNLLSENAKLRTSHLKEVHYTKVSELIANASLVTLPSFAEAFPMTWLEAMAMEKALVTSNIGWANEMMLDGETGFAINPKNHKDYAFKMKTLLEDKILANAFGKNARQRVLKKFDSKVIAAQNIKYYKTIIACS